MREAIIGLLIPVLVFSQSIAFPGPGMVHSVGAAPPAVVQSKTFYDAASGDPALTFDTNPIPGNAIYVHCYWGTGFSSTSVTDDDSNTYNAVDSSAGERTSTFLATNISVSGSLTVTCNSSGASVGTIMAYEISGVSATIDDMNKVEAGLGNNSYDCGSITTTHASDIIIASIIVNSNEASPDFIPPTSFTAGAFYGFGGGGGPNNVGSLASYVVSATNTYNPIYTSSNLGFVFFTCFVAAIQAP